MIAIQKRVKEKWNNDKLYKSYFGYPNLKDIDNSKVKSFKNFIKLFIPPIAFLLKNKVLNK